MDDVCKHGVRKSVRDKLGGCVWCQNEERNMNCPKCLVNTKICGCTWEEVAAHQEKIRKCGKTVCIHGTPTDERCEICFIEHIVPLHHVGG